MYVLKQKKQHNKDDGWWISDIEGDPGRTLKLENAKVYTSLHGAKVARGYYKKRYSHIRKIDLEIEEIS